MKNTTMHAQTPNDFTEPPVGETQGAHRATGVSPTGGGSVLMKISPPDPQVRVKKPRRRLTASYKLTILKEADLCTGQGQIGKLLRREGLYFSSLTRWRRQRDQGVLTALTPGKRGRKPDDNKPLFDQVTRLEKENENLRKKLWQAERIIEVQKKISEILGIDQKTTSSERNDS